ncbi:hypothetical protein BGX38DRAFT_1140325 [Terfezia claveryi]|nr:hypothetical protein BGX38DRAFT_1140325 [Terfezia claveryi]
MKARAVFAPILRASASNTSTGLLELPRGGWNGWNGAPSVAAITRTNAVLAQQKGVARVVSTPTTTVVTLGSPTSPASTAASSYSAVRKYSSSTAAHTPSPSESSPNPEKHTFYSFFPQTLPLGPPPRGSFSIPTRELRQEYLQLQQKLHPDSLRHKTSPNTTNSTATHPTITSSDLSKAYSTLLDPLLRAEYILITQSPHGYDPETAPTPSAELLAEVLELREEIEECKGDRERVEGMMREVEGRIKSEERGVGEDLESGHWEGARRGVGRWRYWRSMMGRLGELEEEVVGMCGSG